MKINNRKFLSWIVIFLILILSTIFLNYRLSESKTIMKNRDFSAQLDSKTPFSEIRSTSVSQSDEFGSTLFVTKWGYSGSGDGQFNYPHGIAINTTGYVYVTDRDNHRIQVFDANGNFITKWGSYGTDDGQLNWPAGIAVNLTGFVYVNDYVNHRIQVFDANGNFITKWGSYGTGDGQFDWPAGIAINSTGYIYVSDTTNHRIQVFDAKGNFISKWGSYGAGDGEFAWPQKLTINSTGFVYVADRDNHRIQVFDANGTFLTKFGNYGTGDGQLNLPTDILFKSIGIIYIVDRNNHRIQVFDANGNFITKWGSLGTADGQFDWPHGIAMNSSGFLFITDFNNHRIQVFRSPISSSSLDIQFVTKWGSTGSGDGQFNSPNGIAINSTDFIYVADRDNYRIQVFDDNGNFITKWGSYGTEDGQFDWPSPLAVNTTGYLYVVDVNNDRIQVFDPSGNFVTKWGSSGSGEGQFNVPSRIAINASGFVYAADVLNHRIQVFDPSGNYFTQWGTEGSGDGQFQQPLGIAINSTGYVYVTDRNNARVQVFDCNGNFILEWGSSGSGEGEFNYPGSIVTDPKGLVYVTDRNNNRIQVFDCNGNFILEWGVLGSGDGEFDYPSQVAMDSTGSIYVTDLHNDRIEVFQWVLPIPSEDNYALSFDGEDDYVDISAVGDDYGSSVITYEVWVNANSVNGWCAILNRGNSENTRGVSLGIYEGEVWVGGRNGFGTVWNYNFVGIINKEVWTFIAAVYNETNGEITVYINGNYIATVNNSFDLNGADYQTHIGANQANPAIQNFAGIIDEVRILNHALVATEVQEDYETYGIYPSRDGVVAWYHCDEGRGSTLFDSSDNGYNGTLHGAGWVISSLTSPSPVSTISSAPQSLSTIVGEKMITLSWDDPASDGGTPILEYRVYRSLTSGEPYSFVGSTTSLVFVDSTVSNDGTYYYVVTAMNAVGESDYSNEAMVTLQGTDGLTSPPPNPVPFLRLETFLVAFIFILLTRKLRNS